MWPHLLLYALSPIAIITSRNVQPDSLALALFDLGLRTYRSTKGEHAKVIWGGAITGLGIAAKGQYFVFLPMIPILMWWHKSSSRAPFFQIGLSTGIALTVPAVWYAHAHFNLAINGATFGVLVQTPKSGGPLGSGQTPTPGWSWAGWPSNMCSHLLGPD